MLHIFAILAIIIIVILAVGLSIIGTVLRGIFGLGKRRSTSGSYQKGGEYRQPNPQQHETSETNEEVHSKRKKLFSEDEGEYVDFEEIKE